MTPANRRLHAIRAAYDAGQKHAIREGRAVWDMTDWEAAAMAYDRALPYVPNPFVN